MKTKLALVAFGFGLLAIMGCSPPLKELHAQAAKDFECPPATGIIDTRTEAQPVKLGSSQRMKIHGCGHQAIYHWDKDNDVWVREPGDPDAVKAKQ